MGVGVPAQYVGIMDCTCAHSPSENDVALRGKKNNKNKKYRVGFTHTHTHFLSV